MPKGTVISIHLSATAGETLMPVNQVRAIPGKGLEGDRYFKQAGTFSGRTGPDREVTLIESEALETLHREHGLNLAPGESRRNITTQGIGLNDLVGREFRVGDVTLRGIKLCEPCSYLAKKTHPDVLRGLVHRGGLRAQVLTEGVICVGSEVDATTSSALTSANQGIGG